MLQMKKWKVKVYVEMLDIVSVNDDGHNMNVEPKYSQDFTELA